MQAAAIQKKKMQAHPLTKFWQEKANWNAVVLYHDLIVLEMRERGYNGHATPLLIDEVDRSIKLPPIKPHYLTRDITDLLCRWEMHGQHGKPREEIPDLAMTVPDIFSNIEEEIHETTFAGIANLQIVRAEVFAAVDLVDSGLSAVKGLLID